MPVAVTTAAAAAAASDAAVANVKGDARRRTAGIALGAPAVGREASQHRLELVKHNARINRGVSANGNVGIVPSQGIRRHGQQPAVGLANAATLGITRRDDNSDAFILRPARPGLVPSRRRPTGGSAGTGTGTSTGGQLSLQLFHRRSRRGVAPAVVVTAGPVSAWFLVAAPAGITDRRLNLSTPVVEHLLDRPGTAVLATALTTALPPTGVSAVTPPLPTPRRRTGPGTTHRSAATSDSRPPPTTTGATRAARTLAIGAGR